MKENFMKNILIMSVCLIATASITSMERNDAAKETNKRKLPELSLSEFPTPEKEKLSPSKAKKLLSRSMPEQESFAKRILQFDTEAKDLSMNDADEKGGRLLLEASQSDEYYTASKEALEMRTDANFASDLTGLTPLHKAVGGLCPRTVKLLLQYRANPTVQDKIKDTPLHLAVYYPYTWDAKILETKTRILEMLLSVKIDSIDCKNNFGNTPLLRLFDPRQQMPVEYRVALAHKLITAGAKPFSQVNLFNKNANQLAKECGCDDLIIALQAHEAHLQAQKTKNQ